jgi:hypothetical protein
MIKRLIGTACGVTAVAGLALAFAPAAGASNTPGTVIPSEFLAGYAGANNGLTSIAAAEGTTTMPNEPDTVPADSVAEGVALQEATGGSSTPTVGQYYVWDDTVHSPGLTCENGAARSDSWVLEAQVTSLSTAPGKPIQPADLIPLPFTGQVVCVTPGTPAFDEVYYSTRADSITLLYGTEPGSISFQFAAPWPHGTMLHEYIFGVSTATGAVASDLAQGHLASFTRDGITTVTGHVVGGHANPRQEMDSLNINEIIGTADGTVNGAPTLTPSSLVGAVGAAFTVTAQG